MVIAWMWLEQAIVAQTELDAVLNLHAHVTEFDALHFELVGVYRALGLEDALLIDWNPATTSDQEYEKYGQESGSKVRHHGIFRFRAVFE
ncbi:MAG: hypothetical protein ACLFVJ_15225 [Persicimonas sp.]